MSKFPRIINFNLNINSWNKRQQILLFCALCCLFLLLNITSLFLPLPQSLTYDEKFYFNTGVFILSGQPSLVNQDIPNSMPAQALDNVIPAQALHPLFSQAVAHIIPDGIETKLAEKLPDIPVYFGKLATISVSLVLALYIFLWTRQIYGINAGFLSLFLYVLDPNIIAHSRVVHQNIFEACAIFVSTYYFWNFLKFGGRKNAILSMITFGIAQITRYTALYLIPLYILLTLIFYGSAIFRLTRTRNISAIISGIKRFLTYIILYGLTALLIINLGFLFEKSFTTKVGDYQFPIRVVNTLLSRYPALKALPVPVPQAYVKGLIFARTMQSNNPYSGASYLMGKLSLKNGKRQGFKLYFILAFLYKVPIATQLLLVIAVTGLIRDRHRIDFWKNEAFLIFPALIFFTIFSLSKAQLGIRYILMIFPFIFVLCSRAAINLGNSKIYYRLFIVLLLAYLMISNLSYFPHYLSYFNELLVNRKFGYTILADSNLDWGQNEFYLKEYLQKHPDTMYIRKKIGDLELSDQQFFDPKRPRSGLLVIDANSLVGIAASYKKFQWIRENLKPIDHVTYNYLIFKIEPKDLPKISENL